MDIVYLLIPLSLALVFAIGAVFLWALKGGQFDDFESAAYSVLIDGEEASSPAITEDPTLIP